MTDTIRQHEPVNGLCPHCGTHEPFNERTCVSRAANPAKDRPEPAIRGYAADDQDTISRRIAELRADRDKVNAAGNG